MKHNLNLLDDRDFLKKYGLFYVGLKDKYYYWEIIVVSLRKMVFTMLAALA